MSYPLNPEREPSSRTVEVLAEHVSNEFSRKWLDQGLHTDAYDLGKVNEGEYYRTAREFTKKHGFTESQALELVNFEIHRGFDIPNSAEFKLLATPMPSGLLNHVALLQNEVPLTELVSQDDTTPIPAFVQEHAAIERYEMEHPGLVPRIVLTRTLGNYMSLKDTCERTEKFVKGLRADEFTTQEEVDDIRQHNNTRIYEWKQQIRTIEKLVEMGVTPLTPAEYTDLVETYLMELIKTHEDRLNPFSSEKHPPLPGTIALQAFFEQRTGKDFRR